MGYYDNTKIGSHRIRENERKKQKRKRRIETFFVFGAGYVIVITLSLLAYWKFEWFWFPLLVAMLFVPTFLVVWNLLKENMNIEKN